LKGLYASVETRACQEKYIRELSVTPVEYSTGAIENHSCGVSNRDYTRYFRGMIFSKVTFTLDGI
jgi:hypothetical protein